LPPLRSVGNRDTGFPNLRWTLDEAAVACDGALHNCFGGRLVA
jgi:hypothetical protein